MPTQHQVTALIAASLLVLSTLVKQGAAAESKPPPDEGIGYPTVAAALADLRARKDVEIWDSDGWTVIQEPANGALWTFTPSDHPAHPAAVRRQVVEREGAVIIQMRALCQAKKRPCDALMAQYKELNESIAKSMQQESPSEPSRWAPSEQQKARAEQTLSRFLQAVDDERYEDAHLLLTAGTKNLIPYKKFRSYSEKAREISGGDPDRGDIRLTWYNNPRHAKAPGVYAAFDIASQFRIKSCAEVIILHGQESGEFLVMRYERNCLSMEQDKKADAIDRKRSGNTR